MFTRLLGVVCAPFLLAASAMAADAGVAPRVSLARPSQPGGGQVFYFVLTDRFANGRTDNDTGGIAGGRDDHGFDPTAISHFHGGDFVGLTARLDYLKGLGTTAIWVTPPFRNKPVQSGSAGYHGYWILDFLQIDPHLGTNEEFAEFVRQAHQRGIQVFMDVILNHTADVIVPEGGDVSYRSRADFPYRDTAGKPFDETPLAYNGVGEPKPFPALSAETSFAHRPTVSEAEKHAKNPTWLNDVRYYHNRGNTDFKGEKSLHGDFVGLDDLFTEHPEVVRGMIDIYRQWIERAQVDGFRIDTAKHTNLEIWQAFGPAMQEAARRAGRPAFFSFGEVATGDTDTRLLSEFSTLGALDASLDFGFAIAARDFVGRAGPSQALAALFEQDDRYTDHDSTALSLPTFLGNHDQGRFGYFLQQLDPSADATRLLALTKLGHALLYLVRGQPVVYYGDEQGMVGRLGNDMQARESLFASQAKDFRSATLLGTTRTGADDKYDTGHPLYRHFAGLAALRAAHPALNRGAMILRPTADPHVFAFSRIARQERVEYVVVVGNQREGTREAVVETSQPAGAGFTLVYGLGDDTPEPGSSLKAGSDGRLTVRVPALGAQVWRADRALTEPRGAPGIVFTSPAGASTLVFGAREIDGQVLAERQEIGVSLLHSDGLAEVTFLASRSSRPGSWDYLGTDDAPPYRIFWRPPADLAPGETVTFSATVDNLRGARATAVLPSVKVELPLPRSGITGATIPVFTQTPGTSVTIRSGEEVVLTAAATAVPAPRFQWYRNGVELPGATESILRLPGRDSDDGARYTVLASNVAGATVSSETTVRLASQGTLLRLPPVATTRVPERPIDVWLPPGYDTSPTTRYPVIYLHDGQNLFDSDVSYGGAVWAADRTLARLIGEGRTRPAILVGIWNTGESRAAEYMPQKALAPSGGASGFTLLGQPVSGVRSDAYLAYLVRDVKPLIDRTFRTLPGRTDTSIMGSSMGGLISAYALLEYPEVFGAAACVSTHWPAADGAMVDYLARRLPAPGRNRWYFDFGTEALDAGYEAFQVRVDAVLRAAGYRAGSDWVTRKFPGADHSERAWSRRVEIPLEFLLRD